MVFGSDDDFEETPSLSGETKLLTTTSSLPIMPSARSPRIMAQSTADHSSEVSTIKRENKHYRDTIKTLQARIVELESQLATSPYSQASGQTIKLEYDSAEERQPTKRRKTTNTSQQRSSQPMRMVINGELFTILDGQNAGLLQGPEEGVAKKYRGRWYTKCRILKSEPVYTATGVVNEKVRAVDGVDTRIFKAPNKNGVLKRHMVTETDETVEDGGYQWKICILQKQV